MSISFSSRFRDYLVESSKLSDINEKYLGLEGYKRRLRIVTGKYKVNQNSIEFIYLPHPNYPIRKELRHKAWEYVFKAGHNTSYNDHGC